MDLKGIISITGMPGLYKISGQMKNGIIVESLEDGKKFPAYATHKVSALEDISIYTTEEDVPLKEVFGMIYKYENGGQSINPNASGSDLKDRALEAIPTLDTDRVYASDLKKLFKWYNHLVEKGIITAEAEATSEEAEKE